MTLPPRSFDAPMFCDTPSLTSLSKAMAIPPTAAGDTVTVRVMVASVALVEKPVPPPVAKHSTQLRLPFASMKHVAANVETLSEIMLA